MIRDYSCPFSELCRQEWKHDPWEWIVSYVGRHCSWEKCCTWIELYFSIFESDISDHFSPCSSRECTCSRKSCKGLRSTIEIDLVWSSIEENPASTRKIESTRKSLGSCHKIRRRCSRTTNCRYHLPHRKILDHWLMSSLWMDLEWMYMHMSRVWSRGILGEVRWEKEIAKSYFYDSMSLLSRRIFEENCFSFLLR